MPKGLFSNLEGIKTSGELAYHFLLDIDFARLDSLKFESELKEKDFRIIEYGATSLSKMSEEFVYTAYENGIPVKTFPVGPSWEHFTPLDSISPLLRMSVMQSEDGAFFYHNYHAAGKKRISQPEQELCPQIGRSTHRMADRDRKADF